MNLQHVLGKQKQAGRQRRCLSPQRLHHHFPQPRQRDHDDEQNRHRRRRPRGLADIAIRDLRQRFSASSNARRQYQKILHRPRQAHADHDPQQPRQIPKLRRQHRPNQRPRPTDRRKMMPKQHPPIRRMIILSIIHPHRRRHARIIQRRHPRRQKRRVIPIRDRQHTQHDNHHGHCMHTTTPLYYDGTPHVHAACFNDAKTNRSRSPRQTRCSSD